MPTIAKTSSHHAMRSDLSKIKDLPFKIERSFTSHGMDTLMFASHGMRFLVVLEQTSRPSVVVRYLGFLGSNGPHRIRAAKDTSSHSSGVRIQTYSSMQCTMQNARFIVNAINSHSASRINTCSMR